VRILANRSPGEVRVALVDGDRLLEAWVERAGVPDGVGDLHRARVSALAPAMAGAFVALGGGETGFLPEKEMGTPAGQPLQRAGSWLSASPAPRRAAKGRAFRRACPG
jgi:Ribonuclease G/E